MLLKYSPQYTNLKDLVVVQCPLLYTAQWATFISYENIFYPKFRKYYFSVLATEPHLKILPEGPQTKRSSRNLFLTCRAQVPNSELIKDMKWRDPEGKEISQDSR